MWLTSSNTDSTQTEITYENSEGLIKKIDLLPARPEDGLITMIVHVDLVNRQQLEEAYAFGELRVA